MNTADKDSSKNYAGICMTNGYNLLEKCGEGSYAPVHLAEARQEALLRNPNLSKMLEKLGTNVVAIKVLDLTFASARRRLRAQTEWHILKKLAENPHLNVVSLLDHFRSGDFLFLVQEYAGLSLLKCMQEYMFSEVVAKNFFTQIVKGVKHLHENGIAHRDLKLENIILGKTGNIKICDFGLASEFNPDDNDITTGKYGTTHYAAPEVKSREIYAYRAKPADIWSLGAVLYILCHRKKLRNKQPNECIQRYLRLSSKLSDDCCDLIRRLLRCYPAERLNVNEILKHPWITSTNELQYDSGLTSEEDSSATLRKIAEVRSCKRLWALDCAIHGTSTDIKAEITMPKSRAKSTVHSVPKVMAELPKIGGVELKSNSHAHADTDVNQPEKKYEGKEKSSALESIYEELKPRTQRELAKFLPPTKKRSIDAVQSKQPNPFLEKRRDENAKSKSVREYQRAKSSAATTRQGHIIKNPAYTQPERSGSYRKCSILTRNDGHSVSVVREKQRLRTPHNISFPANEAQKKDGGVVSMLRSTHLQKRLPIDSSKFPTPPRTAPSKTINQRNIRPGLKAYLSKESKPVYVGTRRIAWDRDKTSQKLVKASGTEKSQNWTREILKNNINVSKAEPEKLIRYALKMERIKETPAHGSMASDKMTGLEIYIQPSTTENLNKKPYVLPPQGNGETSEKHIAIIQRPNSIREPRIHAEGILTSDIVSITNSGRYKRPFTAHLGPASSVTSARGSNIASGTVFPPTLVNSGTDRT